MARNTVTLLICGCYCHSTVRLLKQEVWYCAQWMSNAVSVLNVLLQCANGSWYFATFGIARRLWWQEAWDTDWSLLGAHLSHCIVCFQSFTYLFWLRQRGPSMQNIQNWFAWYYSYQIDQMKLVFWKKMFVNDNTILYSLSRLIRDRFAAVASKYGTLSLAQSVSNIKQVVWNSFITNIRF